MNDLQKAINEALIDPLTNKIISILEEKCGMIGLKDYLNPLWC